MKCIHCQNELPDGSKFCAVCGTMQTENQSTVPSNIQTENTANAVPAPASPLPTAEKKPKKVNKKKLGFAVTAVVLVLASVIIGISVHLAEVKKERELIDSVTQQLTETDFVCDSRDTIHLITFEEFYGENNDRFDFLVESYAVDLEDTDLIYEMTDSTEHYDCYFKMDKNEIKIFEDENPQTPLFAIDKASCNDITAIYFENMEFLSENTADSAVCDKIIEYYDYLERCNDIEWVAEDLFDFTFLFADYCKVNIGKFVNTMFSDYTIEVIPDRMNKSIYDVIISGQYEATDSMYYVDDNAQITFTYDTDENTIKYDDSELIRYYVVEHNPYDALFY